MQELLVLVSVYGTTNALEYCINTCDVPVIHKLNGLVHVLYSNKWQQRTKYLLLHDLIIRRDIFDECRGNVATFFIRLSTTCHCSTGGVHQADNTPLCGSVCVGGEQFNLVELRQILL